MDLLIATKILLLPNGPSLVEVTVFVWHEAQPVRVSMPNQWMQCCSPGGRVDRIHCDSPTNYGSTREGWLSYKGNQAEIRTLGTK